MKNSALNLSSLLSLRPAALEYTLILLEPNPYTHVTHTVGFEGIWDMDKW